MAFAADVTVNGSLEIRSRDFDNLFAFPSGVNPSPASTATPAGTPASNKDIAEANTQRDTQTRVRLDINAKAGDVKGKVELESDFATWGAAGVSGLEKYGSGSGSNLGFREAWINFNMPVIPVNVNVGHQLLALGQGAFFRSMHFGTDAWVVANVTGPNTFAFVNAKFGEGLTSQKDDLDAYVFLDMFKINDNNTIGIDVTSATDRRASLSGTTAISAATNTNSNTAFGRFLGQTGSSPNAFQGIKLMNIGLNYTGKIGPMNLKAEADMQSGIGRDTVATAAALGSDVKFKGKQWLVKGDMAMGEMLGLNFLAARGSGNDPAFVSPGHTDFKQMVTALDIDPHYNFLYEYKVPTAALNVVSQKPTDDNLHTGFANTTALNIGATVAATKNVKISANYWYLQATQYVAINGAVDPITTAPAMSKDLGNEVDVKIAWTLAENLVWTWDLGYMKPGKAYDSNDLVTGQLVKADKIMGAQGILAFKF
jgi:hypothetical protein